MSYVRLDGLRHHVSQVRALDKTIGTHSYLKFVLTRFHSCSTMGRLGMTTAIITKSEVRPTHTMVGSIRYGEALNNQWPQVLTILTFSQFTDAHFQYGINPEEGG